MVQRKVEGRGHHRDAAPLRDARQQRLIRHLGKRAERRAADEMRDALDRPLRLEDVRLARFQVVGRLAQRWIARSAFGPMALLRCPCWSWQLVSARLWLATPLCETPSVAARRRREAWTHAFGCREQCGMRATWLVMPCRFQ